MRRFISDREIVGGGLAMLGTALLLTPIAGIWIWLAMALAAYSLWWGFGLGDEPVTA